MGIKFYLIILAFVSCNILAQDNSEITKYDVFSFTKQVVLPGTPDKIWDIVTGDISPWWDHHMSEHPEKLFIEPRPGGGFWEIFDDEGNGVLHATVIYADRGKLLRFDGPLGLSGKAIQIVTTYQLEPVENDSTKFTLSVHASGEVDKGIPALVEKVWEHFIFEQLQPYVLRTSNQ